MTLILKRGWEKINKAHHLVREMSSLKEQQDVLDAILELDLEKLQTMEKAGVSFDLLTYTPSIVKEIFNSINYEDSFPIVQFLLERNPLNRHNNQMFNYFLNRYDRTHHKSILYYAVIKNEVELVKLILDHNANPNILFNKSPWVEAHDIASVSAGVLSDPYNFKKQTNHSLKNDNSRLYDWITPLEASPTPEMYELLKSAGAVIVDQSRFMKHIKYSLFNYIFHDKNYREKYLLIIQSSNVNLFKEFLEKQGVSLWDEIYVGLRNATTSPEIKKFLWDQYKLKFPFEEFVYDTSIMRPMLSQRGTNAAGVGTCVPDTIFTILFEQQDLATHLLTSDISISEYNVSILRQYKKALDAAKTRYSRMNTRTFKPSIALRRAESISNDLWEYMLYPLQTCPSIGLNFNDTSYFLNDLLVRNKFDIPSLSSSPFALSLVQRRQHPKPIPDPSKIIAFYADIESADGKTAHAIGFIKNNDQWYFLDNNVGFLHKMKDNDYVLSVFLPRFVWSIYNSTFIFDKPDASIFLIPNPHAASDFLNYQFITLGDRLYPNREPPENVLQNVAGRTDWKPRSLIIFSSLHDGDITASAAAGASAAGADARRRRSTRRRKNRI